MPALEMAQEAGVLVAWLKHEGEAVTKGEPIMEIETDKVTIEIDAAASGVLSGIRARQGDRVPVGQTIAWILGPGETPPALPHANPPAVVGSGRDRSGRSQAPQAKAVEVSPLARRMAEEHGVDLSLVRPSGRRIEKSDLTTYLKEQAEATGSRPGIPVGPLSAPSKKLLASPKARRLAAEGGIDLQTVRGTGPDGAVLALDLRPGMRALEPQGQPEELGAVWRLMAERTTASWTSVPHFYLTREVDATNLVKWRAAAASELEQQSGIKPTYTDLLVRLIGATLPKHPRLNAAWAEGRLYWNTEVNVGIAVAIEEGLVVPVIRAADRTSLAEIVRQRNDLVDRAQSRLLRPADIAGATFTLTNLGMYNVDAFNAIVNAPQAAILAVGRISDRVVAQNGQVMIRPHMILTLSCDHRVVDGTRAAQFLDGLANLIEVPLSVLG